MRLLPPRPTSTFAQIEKLAKDCGDGELNSSCASAFASVRAARLRRRVAKVDAREKAVIAERSADAGEPRNAHCHCNFATPLIAVWIWQPAGRRNGTCARSQSWIKSLLSRPIWINWNVNAPGTAQ